MEYLNFNLNHLKKCNQYWEEMSDIEGGRLCTDCNKCIIDFRDKTDYEIAKTHILSQEPVCGLYSEKQLKGKAFKPKSIPRSFKILLYSLLPTILLPTKNIDAKNLDRIEQFNRHLQQNAVSIPQPIPSQAIESDSVIIKGKVFDEETYEELIGVTIVSEQMNYGLVTDIHGDFELKISQEDIKDNLILGFQYLGYATKQIIVTPENQSQFLQVALGTNESQIIEFVIYEKRPLHKRILRGITWPFRKIGQLFKKK